MNIFRVYPLSAQPIIFRNKLLQTTYFYIKDGII